MTYLIETPLTQHQYPRVQTLEEAICIAYQSCRVVKKGIYIWNDNTGKLAGMVFRKGSLYLFSKAGSCSVMILDRFGVPIQF